MIPLSITMVIAAGALVAWAGKGVCNILNERQEAERQRLEEHLRQKREEEEEREKEKALEKKAAAIATALLEEAKRKREARLRAEREIEYKMARAEALRKKIDRLEREKEDGARTIDKIYSDMSKASEDVMATSKLQAGTVEALHTYTSARDRMKGLSAALELAEKMQRERIMQLGRLKSDL